MHFREFHTAVMSHARDVFGVRVRFFKKSYLEEVTQGSSTFVGANCNEDVAAFRASTAQAF